MRLPALAKPRAAIATVAALAMTAGTVLLAAPGAAAEEDAAVAGVPAEVFAALERDLGLSEGQAKVRFAAEHRAGELEQRLRKQLGSAFGGAWIPRGDDRLVVAVTTPAQAAKVRAAGALPKVVDDSKADLDAQVAGLDAGKARAPRTITGWYADVEANQVVINTKPGTAAAAQRFAAAHGLAGEATRINETAESPRPLYDVRGGDAYYIGGGTRCSVGFSVNGGFVTAGHCGDTGASTSGSNQVSQGTFRGSSFPGNDYAWVATNSNWTPRGVVNDYGGGTVSVAGSQEAPVGSTVCRSGSTTGWHCGTIQARNSSVSYPQGTVSGLIRTSVCAEPGDSGGSLLAGNQAQGVTSGGSGDCSSGGTTYFQPVNEILQTYGLSLVTGDGGPGDPPDPPDNPCSGAEDSLTGSLSSGGVAYQPNGQYYRSNSSGTHSGCLAGPSSADFDLYLQKWNGSWTTVARSTSPGPDEQVNYSGTAGYYRYVVHAYSGSGGYTLGITTP
ncbi:S1 family peptidase [Amycolatopsis cihanbeyliensis]|uniref:Streptogrisin C n=1 Tax=Amycolatopsis cihanbeyliensis TaxID=1128664 RepID=A0A542CTM6_AMYCI|nr:S1 family peptidase [Amycolatopsis cihanbeyliensis]TQI94144.1 streptogrisin C [Amycolatopsis cihanbeyliensis]